MNAPSPTTPQATARKSTPGHTIGPFFHDAFRWAITDPDAASPDSVRIEGTVLDGDEAQIPAWLIEAWVPQAVAVESEAGSQAPGFRRLTNDASGKFSLRVPVPAPGQPAAYITLSGLGLTRLFHTAVFLEDADAQASDAPLLEAVPADRRETLIARKVGDAEYHWTIRTQGNRETVFLEYR